MILTIILTMLLVKVSLSTYNVGAMASERTRLQAIADTAAYSAATWQARFLNYCAYTRRAMIANYAHVALITAIEANYGLMQYYDQQQPRVLLPGWSINPDHGPPGPTRIADVIMMGSGIYPGVHTVLVTGQARQTAEILSKMYSDSQHLLYPFVSQPLLTVVPSVVAASNEPVDGGIMPRVEVSPALVAWGVAAEFRRQPGMLNYSMLREAPLDELQEDVEARFDKFTAPGPKASVTSPIDTWPAIATLPYFASRGFHGIPAIGTAIAFGLCQAEGPVGQAFVTELMCSADDTHCDLGAAGESRSEDWYSGPSLWNWYFTGYCIPNPELTPPFIPAVLPIVDETRFPRRYPHLFGGDSLTCYDLVEGLAPEYSEPSVYVALRIPRSEFIGNGTDNRGKLFSHAGLPLGDQVQDMYAVSRAKVVFQPQYDPASGAEAEIFAPNMYHAHWEAELAPFFGWGYDDASLPLLTNGQEVMFAITLEQMLSNPNPATRLLTWSGYYEGSEDWSREVIY